MARVAVCLLTCDREAYTIETCASFHAHNEPDAFVLLHADDGSASDDNRVIARSHGFETCYAPRERGGQMAAVRALVRNAARLGASWIIYLENDWQWVSGFPWEALELSSDCLRLYGNQKARTGPHARTAANLIGTSIPIIWHPKSNRYEEGLAHWGGAPSATRTELLVSACQGAVKLKDVSRALTLRTVRPIDNIVWHIGEETTEGFML